MTADAARRHLEVLAAAPRPAGGTQEDVAREYCATVLRAAGFRVATESFDYSALPGRWGTPLLGLAGAGLMAAAGHLGYRGNAAAAFTILAAGSGVMGILAYWLGRHGVLSLGAARASSRNLVAVRGNAPAHWIVAHLDSKSQPVPILVRAVAIAGMLLTLGAALSVSAVQWAGWPLAAAWPPLTLAGVACAVPVMLSVVQSRSPGALDDASGVATALLVAQTLPPQLALGVVLTSAEELGLAGARAFVRDRPAQVAINIDGVDDEGDLRLTWTRRRPSTLIPLIEQQASGVMRTRTGRLFPGVLLDAVAFADAGWETVTVSRGTVRTVARIHTPRDAVAFLSGAGVATVAGIVRAVIATGA